MFKFEWPSKLEKSLYLNVIMLHETKLILRMMRLYLTHRVNSNYPEPSYS